MQIRLLGGFAVSDDGAPVVALNQTRLKELLSFLIVHRASPLSRTQIAFALWPDSNDAQAQTNLRNTLFRLRKALPALDSYLISTREEMRWRNGSGCDVDLVDFEQQLAAATSARQQALADAERCALEGAVAHYAGDLLPDIFAEWALTRREELRATFLAALARLSALCEQAGDLDAALHFAQCFVREEPLDEIGYQRLMRLHQRRGDRALALRVYHQLSTRLHGELSLEPSPESQALYHVLLENEATQITSPTRSIRPPLVGRDDALATAMRFLNDIASNRTQPSLLLIEGEAGIGKTRLAETILAWARQQGFTTLSAACFRSSRPAYGPIVSWLRQASLGPLDPVWQEELTRLLPELAAGTVPEKQAPVAPWQQQRFLDAIVQALIRQKQPLLLLLDDVQWAERESILVLDTLLRSGTQDRVALIATCRSESLSPDDATTTWLAELQRRGQISQLPIQRLNREDSTLLAEAIRNARLTEAEAEALYRFTEGNPLFVVETIRAQIKVDQVSWIGDNGQDALALPPKMEAVLKSRLGTLSQNALETAQMAAILGRSFSYEVLKALHNMTVETGDELALLRSLDELWHRQIIAAHDREDGLYDFTHDRLRQVAYRELSPIVRRAHHRRAARALAETYAHDPNVGAGQIAQHYERAGANKLAADFHYRAAVHAAGRFAHEQTIRHCHKAIALLGKEDAASPNILTDLYTELARAYRFTARHRESADAFTSALAHTTEPLSRTMLYREAGEAATEQMDLGTAQDRFEQALQELAGLDARGETWWRAWLDTKQAVAELYYYQSQLADLDAVLSEIAAPIAQHGTARQKADYYGALTQLTFGRERYVGNTELMAYVSEALHWAEASGDAEKIALHRFGYGFALLTMRRLDEALASLERAYEAEKRMGNAAVLNQIVIYLLVTLRIQDRVEDVRTRLEESRALAYQQGSPLNIGAAEGHAAWVAYRDGDLSGARQHCATALRHWQQTVYPFQWIACMPALAVALEDGDLAGACDAAQRMTAPNQERLPAALDDALRAAGHAGEQDAVTCEEMLRTALALARGAGYL